MSDQRRLRASDSERDAVLSVLQEAHAAGRLNLGELDERQGQVIAARYIDELAPVVADLPEGDLLTPRLSSGQTALPARQHRSTSVPATNPHYSTVAVMSGRDVIPGPGTTSVGTFNFWGGDEIDLTECLAPGVTVTLESIAIMGGSSIEVPEGVRVLDESVAIMAGNSIDRDARGDGSNGTLVLKGFLFWGGNSVKLARR